MSGYNLSSHEPIAMAPIKLQDLSPWNAFNKVWVTTMGYPAENFTFTPGKTPMSTLSESLMLIAAYLVIVFGGREWMKNRKAFELKGLFMAHNLMLTVVSGTLLTLFAGQLIPTLWNDGLYNGICGAGGWTRPLVVLYYLNYLTKYVELLDTVFLFLKKKPLTFLHCYHHPATALLCYSQLAGETSVSWVPITLNLFVHVIMYWYYFQSARGVKIWWKQYITVLQISQFIIDLGFVYFASWDYFTSTYAPWMPHVGTCAGKPFAAIAGCAILSSYLVLFISFYLATYKGSGKANRDGKKGGVVSGRGHVKTASLDMKKTEVPDFEDTVVAVTKTAKAANSGLHKIAPRKN